MLIRMDIFVVSFDLPLTKLFGLVFLNTPPPHQKYRVNDVKLGVNSGLSY
jgi:hypothetical protein